MRSIVVAFTGFLIGWFMTQVTVHAYEYTPEDIIEIGCMVQQEAGNQSNLGKILVIDTVLNRVDSDDFPNTPHEVINQPEQYAVGSKPPIYVYKLIEDEIRLRTNNQVLYFRKHRYHKYGIPLLKEGDHYFSGGM